MPVLGFELDVYRNWPGPGGIPRDVRRTIEVFPGNSGAGWSSTSAASAFCTGRWRRWNRQRFRFPAHCHQYAALGVKLDDHVGTLVDDPDVVLPIDAYRVR